MNIVSVEMDIGGRKLSLTTGEVAKQAHGSVWLSYGGTVVLATTVASEKAKPQIDFFPLTVEYREKFYAAGRIPGGFFKREGRPADREVLTARLIDRPLRPLFAKGFRNEVQVFATVLSFDQENDPAPLGIIGSSAALTISPIPFMGPVGAVRVGMVGDKFVINPTLEEMGNSPLNLVVAGTQDGVIMVESGAHELPEEVMVEAVIRGQQVIQEIVTLQHTLREKAGKEKWAISEVLPISPELEELVKKEATGRLRDVLVNQNKLTRQKAVDAVFQETLETARSQMEDIQEAEVVALFEKIEREEVRALVAEKGIRVDGRGPRDIRPITCKVGVLPRAHGSALFTRGETQALGIATLGTTDDQQMFDNLEGKSYKSFMLHYNFPSYSVGEVKPIRSPGRREIGHGFLAERALESLLPLHQDFPYTIRLVSEILESNGSSSMATVCGSSLALMDAGVPLKAPVAGIAMGLIRQEKDGRVIVLSDILGTEDHFGDMDFKVAGTAQGITALQMDIKIQGVTAETMRLALEQAREGRLHILAKMAEALDQSRPQLSLFAPRITTFQIKTEKIREVIGPGGKTIRSIIEKTGVSIDVSDDGSISIASSDSEAVKEAIAIIKELTQEAEIGKVYLGKVKKIMDFGAFVEIIPGRDGLVHISQFPDRHLGKIADRLQEGDELLVKVIDIDNQGKIRLSHKDALKESESRK